MKVISSSNWKMNHVEPGSSIHVPINLDSRESSLVEQEGSTVTYQTQVSGVYGNDVNQDAVDSAEVVVNSYSNMYKPFEPAKMVYYGENDRIKAIQVPFAVEPTRNDEPRGASPQPSTNRNVEPRRASPQPPINRHGLQNNVPNEAPVVQAQGVDVSLPVQGSGLRRSSRKRNEAIYNEDLLANRLPRLARRKGGSSKKKPTHCLRMRASNHFPVDSDEDHESE